MCVCAVLQDYERRWAQLPLGQALVEEWSLTTHAPQLVGRAR
jgi:hypothetical protein